MRLPATDPDRSDLTELLRACAGREAEARSAGLTAYLRVMGQSRPEAITSAEHQLRRYLAAPGPDILMALGEEVPLPDVGVPQDEVRSWMEALAGELRAAISGTLPGPAVPETHWEWHTGFPELAQFFGGWFSQDFGEEFTAHEEAVRDYVLGTHPTLVARLLGELAELGALVRGDTAMAEALAELGLEVDPPADLAPEAWVSQLGSEVAAFIAGNGRLP